ncbi:MAG: hypothetical protein ACRENJ_01970, partial [Candidatus Eiseniibacteriota bacterium]
MDPRADAAPTGLGRAPEPGLAIAGALSAGMGLFHFFLPPLFHWDAILAPAPTLRWGVPLINASFSYLLLAGGVITLVIAFRPALKRGVGGWLIAAMAGYWVLNAVWQVVLPMPIPRALAHLRWAFLGYGLAVALLYASA